MTQRSAADIMLCGLLLQSENFYIYLIIFEPCPAYKTMNLKKWNIRHVEPVTADLTKGANRFLRPNPIKVQII